MNGVERSADAARRAAPPPARRRVAVGIAAAAAMVAAAILAGTVPARAEGADGGDGSESVDIGSAPTPPSADDQPEQADLVVTMTASTPGPFVGHSFSWALQVTNNGPDGAVAVVVSDIVPDLVSVLGVQSDAFACSAAGNSVTCTRPELAAGATGTITVEVMVPDSLVPETVTNTANVTSAAPDVVPGNNAATSSVVTVVVEVGGPVPPASGPDVIVLSPAVPLGTVVEDPPPAPGPSTTTSRAPVATPDLTDILPSTGITVQPLWVVAAEALLAGLALCRISRRRTVRAG